ncbi:MAG: phospholipase D-like domain-containing protein [Candidatus Yanofskybacteria bacterium]|nr:phospholipase D-like domain-containing protein [Candidatus Yanofskybacteria bacterium]
MNSTHWKFYAAVRDTWEAMYEDCSSAQRSIDFEQYIFQDDDISKKFAKLFIEKAKQGVSVRLLCDMVGSAKLYTSPLAEALRDNGVEVRFFNPISPWRLHNFTSWFFRNHRKLIIVDGHIGHTGGVGVNSEMEDWRDTDVRISGPVVEQFQYAFNNMWNMASVGKFIPFSFPKAYSEGFKVLTNSPRRRQRFIHRHFIEAMRGAAEYLYLTTPYFVPDNRFFRTLRSAARRGVDTRLLIPGYSDVLLVYLASRRYFDQALEAGVKIYLYDSNKVLHAKTAAIDDVWGTVGSTNLDNLSFRFNYEINIAGIESAFVRRIKGQFLKDLEASRQLILSEWRNRPLLDKIKELITWPLDPIL